MSTGNVEQERAKRAAEGLRLYIVISDARAAPGDRSAFRKEHIQFLQDLEAQGRLFASGPVVDDATGESLGRAISIVRGRSIAEVDALMRNEPFFRNGFRTFTVQAWRFADGDALKAERARKDRTS